MKNETVILRNLMNFKIRLMEIKSIIECARSDNLIRLLDEPLPAEQKQKTEETIRTQAILCGEYADIITEFDILLCDIEETLSNE